MNQQINAQQESLKKKNTVLVLPHIDTKQRLTRIGEVYRSRCRDTFETLLPGLY